MLLVACILCIFLIMTLLGMAGVLASFVRRWKILARLRIVYFVLVGAGLLGVVSCLNCYVWDGSFGQAEFQLVFQDQDGNPIQGVELCVVDRKGQNYFHFPVDDYVPGKIPTSDRDGLMLFHHVSRGIEFSGRTYYVLFAIPITEPSLPTYDCRFLYKGQEVYRIAFGELDSWKGLLNDVSNVRRRWRTPIWDEMLARPGETDKGWHDRIMGLFGHDANATLGTEGAAASYSALTQADECRMAQMRGVTRENEIEFAVVRKNISVNLGASCSKK